MYNNGGIPMKFKILFQKDFFLLTCGKLVSLLGSNMQQFALSLYVLAITGSAAIFASVLSISIIPRLLLSPIAGLFGDWFNRKKTIIFVDLINTIVVGLVAVIFALNGKLTLPMIYALVIILEITEIFFGAAMSAVIPSIVKQEDMLEANSVNSFVMNVGNLVAPVLAAALYGSFGMQLILILNSLSFLLSAIGEMFINIPPYHKHPEKINLNSFKTGLMEGIEVIKANKLISTMILLGTVINFCVSPLFSIGLIYVLKIVLKSTDFQFGIFQMILSASLLTAPIICTGIFKKVKIGKLCFTSFLAISLLIILMAVIPSSIFINLTHFKAAAYISIAVISFLIGLSTTVANIALSTLFNKVTPISLMGRTSTVFNLAVTISIPIGQIIFGILYDKIPASLVITICGVLMLIAVVLFRSSLVASDRDQEKSVPMDASIKTQDNDLNYA